LQLSESSAASSVAAALLQQRSTARSSVSGIGSIPPPGSADRSNNHTHSSLTQANLARINNANAQECHQGKASLHQTLKKGTHKSESVADASYYSSVLASFGGNPGTATAGPPTGSSGTAGGAGASGIGSAAGAGSNPNSGNTAQLTGGYETSNLASGGSSNWQSSQYYR